MGYFKPQRAGDESLEVFLGNPHGFDLKIQAGIFQTLLCAVFVVGLKPDRKFSGLKNPYQTHLGRFMDHF